MTKKMMALAVAAGILYAAAAQVRAEENKGGNMQQTIHTYKTTEYPGLSGVPGFSAQLIADHLKLYNGYVKNTNELSEKLGALLAAGKEKTPEYAELKRRFGWEFNGMRLHELYFGNLAGTGKPGQNSRVYKAIQEEFGSFETWKNDFTATGSMRGIGWVALYRDGVSGRLFNAWIDQHDGGHLAGCTPLLVMDVFEHAFMTDYRLDKAMYIEAFFAAINWDVVGKRWPK